MMPSRVGHKSLLLQRNAKIVVHHDQRAAKVAVRFAKHLLVGQIHCRSLPVASLGSSSWRFISEWECGRKRPLSGTELSWDYYFHRSLVVCRGVGETSVTMVHCCKV